MQWLALAGDTNSPPRTHAATQHENIIELTVNLPSIAARG